MIDAEGHAKRVALEILSGPHKGERHEFAAYTTWIIGRSRRAQFRIDDPHVSRQHFRLEINPPQIAIVDLQSKRGTLLNGQPVNVAVLQHCDVISIGHTKLRVLIDAPQEPSSVELSDTLTVRTRPASRLELPGIELYEQVGRGGMGFVCRALHKASQRECAVKLILPQVEVKESVARLFLREASVLSKLNHPRIVDFYEVGIHQGQLFLVMEYVPAIDFCAFLAKAAPARAVRAACGMICHALEALQYAHTRQIVHRDIKPSNLLVTRQNGRLRMKLADFGLAKNFVEAGLSGLTTDDEARGTLVYMAPEQLLDCRTAKPPCDIYSAGVSLYRFLAGRAPFQARTISEAMHRILSNDFMPLPEVRPDLPAELIQAVHQAMDVKPEKRFPSAAAMRRAILPFARQSIQA